MSKIADQTYLLTQQYDNASRLHDRLALHERFSTSSYEWHLWVFDLFEIPATCRVLELGCGSGLLWQKNAHRIPAGWELTLSDFSAGMLEEARHSLELVGHPFTFEQFDAQSIPHPDESFDAVIANHMLYHVPNREATYAEVRRILRPGGSFYAATGGTNNMRELRDLVRRFDPALVGFGGVAKDTFLLENGSAELARWFSDVIVEHQPNGLVVTEAEPIVAYVWSYADPQLLSPERRAAFLQYVEQEITKHGPIRITKDNGVIRATKT